MEAISPEQVSQISGYLDTWENVSFDDKRRVVDLMITTIAATSDSLKHHMENLTGGTPPVRYLPCVVPCKLYFPVVLIPFPPRSHHRERRRKYKPTIKKKYHPVREEELLSAFPSVSFCFALFHL